MAKFCESNWDILETYYNIINATVTPVQKSYIIGLMTSVVSKGGYYSPLWTYDEDAGYIGHRFIIEEIQEDGLLFSYDSLMSEFSLATSEFESGTDVYIRKDSYFHDWLIFNSDDYRDYINTNKNFIYLGKIYNAGELEPDDPTFIAGRTLWKIPYEGMFNYMKNALPENNRTTNVLRLLDLFFDHSYHPIYNLTKNIYSLMDTKEIDIRFIGYIASNYGIEIDEDMTESNLREWVGNIINLLKRKGTYSSYYIIWKMLLSNTLNKLHIYENWGEYCEGSIRDIPTDLTRHHIIEPYNRNPTGAASAVDYYSEYDYTTYPTHMETPPVSCSLLSLGPTGYNILTPHYDVELDLTYEPLGNDYIISEYLIDELTRNWEYVKPVSKFVKYYEFIAPSGSMNTTREPIELYRSLTKGGYLSTKYTGITGTGVDIPTSYDQMGWGTYNHTQTINNNTWTIKHSLGTEEVLVWVYNSDYTRIYPDEIRILDENWIEITFPYSINGFAIIAESRKITGTNSYYDKVVEFLNSPSASWLSTHNLGTSGASGTVYQLYNSDKYVVMPSGSELLDSDSMQAIWSEAISGSVNFRRSDYHHTQNTESATWVVDHNLDAGYVIVQVWDGDNRNIQPDSIVMNNANRTTITFSEAISGSADFVYFLKEFEYEVTDSDVMGVGLNTITGYWKTGNGTARLNEYDPVLENDVQSVTASGSLKTVKNSTDNNNFIVEFDVDTKEDLEITEFGIFNGEDEMQFYTQCSTIFKPDDITLKMHYRIKKPQFI